MNEISYLGKSYQVDGNDFLLDHRQWDEDFVKFMSLKLNMIESLSEKHWEVIFFIRDYFLRNDEIPLIYQTCRSVGLTIKDFKNLFPQGYMRGACKLAGITYRDRVVNYYGEINYEQPEGDETREANEKLLNKVYRVDVFGFLIDSNEWDKYFAIWRAREMKISGGLSEKHWHIIRFMRERFKQNGILPTVIECCEANNIEIDELEKLFPLGYHRCAVKIAGLRLP